MYLRLIEGSMFQKSSEGVGGWVGVGRGVSVGTGVLVGMGVGTSKGVDTGIGVRVTEGVLPASVDGDATGADVHATAMPANIHMVNTVKTMVTTLLSCTYDNESFGNISIMLSSGHHTCTTLLEIIGRLTKEPPIQVTTRLT